MLRMTPLASAIVALLLGIEAYAAEETFDTHFMIGGMKDQQVANIRLDDNQPLPGQYDIDIYVNKQWRGKYFRLDFSVPQAWVEELESGGDAANLLI
ncbi:fimbrial outer membrane usher protein [Shigella sonnei]|nr:fimbrial outer membrane usher protein [Shigella sonnei]